MPAIRVSTNELLNAVEQWSAPELEAFAERVHVLRARRKAPCLSSEESRLLREINRGLPEEVHKRYDQLVALCREERLTDEAYQELLQLTDLVEEHNAQRIANLVQLAHLRGVSFDQLRQRATDGPGSAVSTAAAR